MKIWFFIVVLLLCPAIAKADIAFIPSWDKKVCPEDTPLLDNQGTCQTCDTDQALIPHRSGDCSLCPDRHERVFHREHPIMSYKKDAFCLPAVWKLPEAGACPEDRPLRGEDDYCYPCSLIYFHQIPLHNPADRTICPEKSLEDFIQMVPSP